MNAEEIPHVNRMSIAIAEAHDIGLDESIERMKSVNLHLIAGDQIKHSSSMQAAFLTALNAGKRSFLGGVYCSLPEDVPNLLQINAGSFNELATLYGGLPGDLLDYIGNFEILFGLPAVRKNSLEVVMNGWQAGVNFYGSKRIKLSPKSNNVTLGGVAAAALGLFHAFDATFQLMDIPHNTSTGFSLWDLNSEVWHKEKSEGPSKLNLPRQFWSVGLGHLGQAYLWTLALLPFDGRSCLVSLQDFDIVEEENIGAQVLSTEDHIGLPKARVCSTFLSNLGFKTQIIEKPFLLEDQKAEWSSDYKILLNGVDNISTRTSVLSDRFSLFLDGATNGKLELFDSFTLRNFAKLSKKPEEVWKEKHQSENILHRKLFERVENEFGCGQLINKGISTPFVGLFGASLVVAELLRSLNKGLSYSSISGQMRNLEALGAVSKGFYDKQLLNLAL
ncbi:ThiF family adenylyltransferase [Fulvivirgaceae bacterium BMA12]|uniref:ThiF family adenylyltransferase n=1 Tax=Agaribacillus aureus TaxID=3051825 RepID=A0ABT8LEU6_9BACT|nr:ThiF family adenylyltransferase [Fulvivirgaceae bacterium BMA12]